MGMRNPYWAPEYTGRRPTFNEMGMFRLNPQHSLNYGQYDLWLFNELAGSANSHIKRNRIVMPSVDFQMGPDGVNNINVDKRIQTSGKFLDLPTGTDDFTIAFYYNKLSTTNDYIITSNGYNNNASIWLRDNSNLVGWYYTTYGTNYWTVTAAQQRGLHLWVISAVGTAVSLYRDGVMVGTPQTRGNNDWSTFYYLGANGAGLCGLGIWEWMATYTRALTSSEIKDMYLYPWGTPDNPRFIIEPSVSYFILSGVTFTESATRSRTYKLA